VGKTRLSSFHDRLWKHCCKVIGECGGKYNKELQKDDTDETQPRDTKNWANYRHNQFKGFSTWCFSFYRLDESNFEMAKDKITLMEDITMLELSYRLSSQQPLCNGSPSHLTVKFPWMHK